MVKAVSRMMWWPSPNIVRNCAVCLEKMKVDPHVGEPVDCAAQEPGQVLYLDIMGPIVTTPDSGYKYILVAMDSYSKCVFLKPLENKTGVVVAQTLLDRIFLLNGVPDWIYIDGGLEFINSITQKLFSALKCTVKVSAPYHHQSNLAERTIRMINDRFRAALVQPGWKSQ